MKIGILTFHWATNYGAVLQAYALQTYLESQGHEVKIVNYKPWIYDNNILSFFVFRRYKNIAAYKNDLKKEKVIQRFRQLNLHLTKRAYNCSKLPSVTEEFDVLISGSDQVLNPNFLRNGDFPKVTTPSYFLSFPFNGIKVGYAVSFGCSTYPKEDSALASRFISEFDKLSVREQTGISIASSLGREDAVLVPDPTAFLSKAQYEAISNLSSFTSRGSYTYCFFIRNVEIRKQQVLLPNTIWNQEDGLYGMEDWLKKIKEAQFVVTDSFHCVMMCLKLHVPFVVVTEWKGNMGMNDRLITLLNSVGLDKNLCYIDNLNLSDFVNLRINWAMVDDCLTKLSNKGIEFLTFKN